MFKIRIRKRKRILVRFFLGPFLVFMIYACLALVCAGDAAKLSQAELGVIDEAAAIPLPLVCSLLGPYLVFMIYVSSSGCAGDAAKLSQAELVVIDEAAAIPLPLVRSLLGPYLVFMASTINGYEGTGRSLRSFIFLRD